MLATLSAFQVFEGIAAIAKDTIYVVDGDYTYKLSVTAWGWIHVIIGAIGLIVGVGIMAGLDWALMAGLVVAVMSAVTHFIFLPFFPIWAVVILAFDVIVIWALSTELWRERPAVR